MKEKYINELLIKNVNEKIYYFVFAVKTENKTIAEKILKSYKTGLESNNFKVIMNKTILVEDYNFPKEYSKGNIAKLTVAEWKFHNIDSIPELDFKTHCKIAIIDENTNKDEVAKIIMEHKIPIFQLSKIGIEEYKDLYFINVVKAD